MPYDSKSIICQNHFELYPINQFTKMHRAIIFHNKPVKTKSPISNNIKLLSNIQSMVQNNQFVKLPAKEILNIYLTWQLHSQMIDFGDIYPQEAGEYFKKLSAKLNHLLIALEAVATIVDDTTTINKYVLKSHLDQLIQELMMTDVFEIRQLVQQAFILLAKPFLKDSQEAKQCKKIYQELIKPFQTSHDKDNDKQPLQVNKKEQNEPQEQHMVEQHNEEVQFLDWQKVKIEAVIHDRPRKQSKTKIEQESIPKEYIPVTNNKHYNLRSNKTSTTHLKKIEKSDIEQQTQSYNDQQPHSSTAPQTTQNEGNDSFNCTEQPQTSPIKSQRIHNEIKFCQDYLSAVQNHTLQQFYQTNNRPTINQHVQKIYNRIVNKLRHSKSCSKQVISIKSHLNYIQYGCSQQARQTFALCLVEVYLLLLLNDLTSKVKLSKKLKEILKICETYTLYGS